MSVGCWLRSLYISQKKQCLMSIPSDDQSYKSSSRYDEFAWSQQVAIFHHTCILPLASTGTCAFPLRLLLFLLSPNTPAWLSTRWPTWHDKSHDLKVWYIEIFFQTRMHVRTFSVAGHAPYDHQRWNTIQLASTQPSTVVDDRRFISANMKRNQWPSM